jgi:type II secretory pathway pseudopilin PulG
VRGAIRDEGGFTLVEMLVVTSLLIVVLSAVLGAFETFGKTSTTNQKINEAQDTVRVAIDSVTRELRNLASPTNELPLSILRADPNGKDLIFLSVAGNKPAGSLNARNTRQVRYCLDDAGVVYREEQTWTSATTPALPSSTACGPVAGDTWPTRRILVRNVTNGSRPLFSYNATATDAITDVAVSLWVDPDPGRTPTEIALQSAIFLRNQNRAPTAAFDIQVSGGTFVLNASDSGDPEGRSLLFYWYDEARSDEGCGSEASLPAGVPAAGCIGTGLVFNYTPPSSGNRTIHVIARDPAGLQTTSTSKTCNSTGSGC